MRVKRFTAADMAAAMREVRKALGPDAVILATGPLPGGGVEITAAIEPDQAVAPVAAAQPAAARRAAAANPAPPAPPADPAAPAAPAGRTGEAEAADIAALVRRVEGLQEMVSRHLVLSEAAQNFMTRPEVAPLYSHLSGQEVEPAIIAELLADLAAPGGRNLSARLAIRLKKLLNVFGGLSPDQPRPAVWALVGPTGVGKTTTVAKLAATYTMRHRLKVGLITLDTYRIAAAEQLMVYGRIMEVETRVASNAAEYLAAVEAMADADLILVDTVGRSPRDQANLAELRQVLAAVPRTQSHLVLACPTRDADLQAAQEAFAAFDPASLIFTKLDETRTFGPILNQVAKSGRPVSFLTCGQKVPDDLEIATREGLARRLLPPRGRAAAI